MIDVKREHAYGRDCWCNPLVISVGSKLITDYAGTVVRYEPIAHEQIAVHIEPHSSEVKEGE